MRITTFHDELQRCLSDTKIMEIVRGLEYLHRELVVHGDLRGVSFPQ